MSAIGHNSDDVLTQAAQTRPRSIADTIKSLKPGDRVRVTFEDEVERVHEVIAVLKSGFDLEDCDPTITSIEVIERPLQVGDEVVFDDVPGTGRITAIGETKSLVLWKAGMEREATTARLRRAS